MGRGVPGFSILYLNKNFILIFVRSPRFDRVASRLGFSCSCAIAYPFWPHMEMEKWRL